MINSLFKLFVIISLFFSCTENPFGESSFDEESNILIYGSVTLDSDLDHAGIAVWLDGLDILTFTDSKGGYSISIPKNADAAIGSGLTGNYTIYYFVSNYHLQAREVFLFDSSFKYGEADLNEEGMVHTVNLERIFSIENKVTTDSFNPLEGKPLVIQTDLTRNSPSDDFNVLTHKAKSGALTAYFIRSLSNPDQVYLFRFDLRLSAFPLGSFQSLSGICGYDFLPSGIYEVFTYINTNTLAPDGLIRRFGERANEFHEDFLKIPVRQTPAIITIP